MPGQWSKMAEADVPVAPRADMKPEPYWVGWA